MSKTMTQASALRDAFDRIEEAYEFMLAYAAQGRRQETSEDGGESQIRRFVTRFEAALGDVEEAIAPGLGGDAGAGFRDRFAADIKTTRSILGLLLSRPSISSEMIDNTNGLIAMRALLTDVFFVDTAVLPER